jgi:LysM repeat protein
MYKIYQVEMGETLDSIASKLNTSVDNLKNINGIKGNVTLRPGSYLIVPTLDDRFTTYIVKKGDSIYSISQKYGVDPNMILKLNGLESETYIYPNQEILIPNKNYNFYITKQGDTITSVAEELNENVVDLLNKNETLFLEEDQLIIYR